MGLPFSCEGVSAWQTQTHTSFSETLFSLLPLINTCLEKWLAVLRIIDSPRFSIKGLLWPFQPDRLLQAY